MDNQEIKIKSESAELPRACDISKRFRGFLPVVVDVETAGFDPEKNALLEVAAMPLALNDKGIMVQG